MKKNIVIRMRALGLSYLFETRAVRAGLGFAVLLGAVLVTSCTVGSLFLHPLAVLKTFFGFGSETEHLVLFQFRLPRILTAMMVGAALSVSGAILQGMIRNPLASPDLLGIVGGGSMVAVGFLILFPDASIHWLPPAALIGAILVTLILYLLAWKDGVTPARLVLIGVGLQFLLAALTNVLIVRSPLHLTERAMVWMTGSVYGSNWTHVAVFAPWLMVFIPLAFAASRRLNALQMGDDVAAGIGNPVQRSRLLLVWIATGLAGSGIAVGGAVGFVGLLGPHIARRFVGSSGEALIPLSALIGALITALADLIGRTAFSPVEIPLGVFTSIVGAAFFMYLLFKYKHL